MSLAVAAAMTVARLTLATGVTLEYVERGDPTGTPVIFLHGVTDSWRSFEHLLPHLPASLHAFAITQRGHGGSSKPDGGYAYGDFAADVAAFMDAKGLPTAVIVGHSMGGQVAQRLAMERPERVRSLVLVSTFHTLRGHELVQELWDTGIGTMKDPIDPAFVRAFQEGTVATPIAAAHMDTFVAESLKVPARVWQAAFREFLDADLGDQRRIAAPTLVLSGGKDPLSRSEERAALLGRIRGATAVDYADLGHAPHWEDPARVASDIARFVAGVQN